MANAWQLHGNCIGYCVANAWHMHGNWAWRPHGKRLATAWQMHGKLMTTAWQTHGNIMANAWQLQYQDYEAAWPGFTKLKQTQKQKQKHCQRQRQRQKQQQAGRQAPLAQVEHATPQPCPVDSGAPSNLARHATRSDASTRANPPDASTLGGK